jgi:hypothetical protein
MLINPLITSYLRMRLLVVIPVIDISNEGGLVKSVLISFLFPLHTLLRAHDRALSSKLFCLCPTCSLGPSCFIDSVLPTKHLFDHFRP